MFGDIVLVCVSTKDNYSVKDSYLLSVKGLFQIEPQSEDLRSGNCSVKIWREGLMR